MDTASELSELIARGDSKIDEGNMDDDDDGRVAES